MTSPEIVPAEPGSRVVGERRDTMKRQMATAYANGSSVREVAERFGRSYGAAHRMLREASVTLRPRGGRHA